MMSSKACLYLSYSWEQVTEIFVADRNENPMLKNIKSNLVGEEGYS